MSRSNRLVLPAILSALAALAACGGSNKATPPPSGAFSVSSLNGTYVFSTTGTDSTTNGGPIQIVGAFTVTGTGTISSGGAFTFEDPDPTIGSGSNQAITGGTYTVTADGRGQAHLLNGSTLGTVTLDFALASSDHGVITEYDGNGSGSGTLDLQSSVPQSDIDGQSYAFSVSGVGSDGPIATAGAFTLDSSGVVTTGVQDLTSTNVTGGTLIATSTEASLNDSSSVAVGTGSAPGTAGIGGFTFDVYAIDATHLKLIETDGTEYMSGDIFSQQTTLPSGTLAFSMAGMDLGTNPLSIGGLLPVSGGVISGGIEDFNDSGTAGTSNTAVSGGFTALSGGRSTLTLIGIVNGGSNQLTGTYTFAAYPSSGGTLLLENDNSGITTGVALAQSTTTFAASTGYAVNLSGANTNGEEDDIAEFTATSSGFSGLVDYNNTGTGTGFDKTLNGNYTSLSTGRYSLTSNAWNGNFYTVDGTTVLFLETDSTQVGNGIFLTQTAPSSSSHATVAHFVLARPMLAKGHWSKRTSK